MRDAGCLEPPDDQTILAVAQRIVREQSQNGKIPVMPFHYDSDAANRGRANAAKTSHDRAVARRQIREKTKP